MALFCHDDGGQTLRLLEKLLRFFAEKYGGDDCEAGCADERFCTNGLGTVNARSREAHPSSDPCRKGATDAAQIGSFTDAAVPWIGVKPRIQGASKSIGFEAVEGVYWVVRHVRLCSNLSTSALLASTASARAT